jgi:hypothetical protein
VLATAVTFDGIGGKGTSPAGRGGVGITTFADCAGVLGAGGGCVFFTGAGVWVVLAGSGGLVGSWATCVGTGGVPGAGTALGGVAAATCGVVNLGVGCATFAGVGATGGVWVGCTEGVFAGVMADAKGVIGGTGTRFILGGIGAAAGTEMVLPACAVVGETTSFGMTAGLDDTLFAATTGDA